MVADLAESDQPDQEFKISLFDEYEFSANSNYRLVLMEDNDYEASIIVVDDYKHLNLIKNRHQNVSSFFNNDCEFNHQNEMTLLMFFNKKLVNSFDYQKECNWLATPCGPIRFDDEILAKLGRSIELKEYQEKLQSIIELDKKVAEIQTMTDCYFYDYEQTFLGSKTVDFYDENDLVGRILADTFWLNDVNVEMTSKYQPPSYEDEDRETLFKIGQILSLIFNQKFVSGEYSVVSWERIDSDVRNYRVNLEFDDKSERPVHEGDSSYVDISTYTLFYWKAD